MKDQADNQTKRWGSHTLRVYIAKDGSLSVRMGDGAIEPSGLSKHELNPEDLIADDVALPTAGWETKVWQVGSGEMLAGLWHWQVHEPGLKDTPYARGFAASEQEADGAAEAALDQITELLGREAS